MEPQSPQLQPQVHSCFFHTSGSHNSALTLSSSLCGVHVGERTETTMPQSYLITFYLIPWTQGLSLKLELGCGQVSKPW